MILFVVNVYSYRRSCSLDVEVSASGFTKDLERDAALLHPAGPEEDDDMEDNDDEEDSTDEEAEREEESLDVDEYKHAMLELEGLKVSETHAGIRDEEEEVEENEKREEEKETERAPEARSDEETENDLEEELKEAEDECPELTDLSASNKEFKPFR